MKDINFRINKIIVEFFNDNNSKFAAFLGTSEANIRNYRTKTEPKIEYLNKIASELEINYEWLLNGSGSMLRETKNIVSEPTAAYFGKNENPYVRLLEEQVAQLTKDKELLQEDLKKKQEIIDAFLSGNVQRHNTSEK